MEAHISVAKNLAKLLDSEFKIFNFTIGLDPIIGLIPWIGDIISLGLSLYIIWIGYRVRLPQHIISAMIGNVLFDFMLGLIPIVGDISDFFYKANKKNLHLLLRHVNTSVVEGTII